VTCRRLAEVKPDTYSSLEALGICTLDAGSESNIPGMAQLYRTLGKRTFAMCDKQDDGTRALIEAQVEILLMHEESGFENLVLKGTPEEAIKRFAKLIDWPPHLKTKYPDPELQAADALADYFAWSKGTWGVADFLAQCSEAEIPNWLREASLKLKEACIPAPAAALAAAATADGAGAPGASVDAAH
jgi:putative ATP-dependent endonuclease of OLD family